MASRNSHRGLRQCWRVPGFPDAVMFHGRHDHEFIAHAHDVATVIVVTRGAVQIKIENRTYRVEAGQLVLIGAHQVHAARPATPAGWEMRSMHLPPHLLAAGRDASADRQGTVAYANPVVSGHAPAASLFLDLHRGLEAGRQETATDQFQSFVAWLRGNMETFRPRHNAHHPTDLQLERARVLIAEAVLDNLRLDCVAEEVGLTSYALIRRFKKCYGIPPHAWRMQMRANAAAGLLREHAPLVEVAGACGFADQSHMSRIFKKVYGVTPGQYGLMH